MITSALARAQAHATDACGRTSQRIACGSGLTSEEAASPMKPPKVTPSWPPSDAAAVPVRSTAAPSACRGDTHAAQAASSVGEPMSLRLAMVACRAGPALAPWMLTDVDRGSVVSTL